MVHYRNIGGNSGIREYEIGPDFIRIKFKFSRLYEYNYMLSGQVHVENMKILALMGKGLNGYIKKYVKSRCKRISSFDLNS